MLKLLLVAAMAFSSTPLDLDLKVYTAYLATLETARRQGVDLAPWFKPERIVHVVTHLDALEKRRLLVVLEDVRRALHETPRDLPALLARARHPEAAVLARDIDRAVERLFTNYRNAVTLGNHTLGPAVRRVLKAHGHGPRESLRGLQLATAGWLLESTVTHEEIETIFGRDILRLMDAVTPPPRRPDQSHAEWLEVWFERADRRQAARLLLLAKLIVEAERADEAFLTELQERWPLLQKSLYRPGEADTMWWRFERALNCARALQTSPS